MSIIHSAQASWSRLIFLAVIVATLAAIVHIAAILLVPHASKMNFLSVAENIENAQQTHLISTSESHRFLDPATAVAVCAFDLTKRPMRIQTPTSDGVLTMSFHGPDGRVFYALSDRAAQKNLIDLMLMTRRQLDEAINQDDEDEIAKDVRLLSPVTTGLVVIRVLALQPSDMKEARMRALQMRCQSDLPGATE